MKTYVVSITEIDPTETSAWMQHLEVFKCRVYPEVALANESKVAAELGKRVEYIKDLVLGNVTMELEGEEK